MWNHKLTFAPFVFLCPTLMSFSSIHLSHVITELKTLFTYHFSWWLRQCWSLQNAGRLSHMNSVKWPCSQIFSLSHARVMLIRINLSLSYAAFHRKDNYSVDIHDIVHSALFMFVTYLKLISFLIIYESPDLLDSVTYRNFGNCCQKNSESLPLDTLITLLLLFLFQTQRRR